MRTYVVRVEDDAEPALIAEALAFLASPRTAATNRTAVPVGARVRSV